MQGIVSGLTVLAEVRIRARRFPSFRSRATFLAQFPDDPSIVIGDREGPPGFSIPAGQSAEPHAAAGRQAGSCRFRFHPDRKGFYGADGWFGHAAIRAGRAHLRARVSSALIDAPGFPHCRADVRCASVYVTSIGFAVFSEAFKGGRDA